MRMWSFRRDACSRRQPLPAGPQLTDPPPADSVLLQGSWDLARKVIKKVTLYKYNKYNKYIYIHIYIYISYK